MAHFVYRKSTNSIINVFETLPSELQLSAEHVVVEYDLDESNDYLGSLRLSDDEQSLVNIYSGKSIEEQIQLCTEEQNLRDIENKKQILIDAVKVVAKGKIEALTWKVERAKERDLLNGNDNAMLEVATEREAIRQASNEFENTILSLNSLEELNDIEINF